MRADGIKNSGERIEEYFEGRGKVITQVYDELYEN